MGNIYDLGFQVWFHSCSKTLVESIHSYKGRNVNGQGLKVNMPGRKICAEWAPGMLNKLASSLAVLGSQNGW